MHTNPNQPQPPRGGSAAPQAARRYYVIWQGRATGIFNSWDECEKHVMGYKRPQYRSYETLQEAQTAFAKGYYAATGTPVPPPLPTTPVIPAIALPAPPAPAASLRPTAPPRKRPGSHPLPDALAGRSGSLPLETRILIGKWNSNSIAVDAAWNPVSKHIEYQGVNLKTGAVVFHKGPFAGATGNIGEFLAIVHGLAYLKQQQSDWPIYSDSRTAIAWVKARRTNSGLALNSRNQVVFDLVKRAESWLAQNDYENKVLKWETGAWGENPADFGR